MPGPYAQNACGYSWEFRQFDGHFPEAWYCGYCGSVHPEDAVRFLKQPGTTFSGSDWKYGWPHKFYIAPPSPEPEKEVEIGSRSERVDGKFVTTPIMGKRSTLHAKFYNNHLKDAAPEVFEEFAALSEKIFGIKWSKDEKGISYDSFYRYQRAGKINQDGQPEHQL
jgi:hypothetical protein